MRVRSLINASKNIRLKGLFNDLDTLVPFFYSNPSSCISKLAGVLTTVGVTERRSVLICWSRVIIHCDAIGLKGP